MMKPQRKKYRVFARDFDKKPKIKEFNELEEVKQFMEEEEWITISIEQKLKKHLKSKKQQKNTTKN